MLFDFDEDKFLATAKVVLKYNECAAGFTVEQIVDQMKEMARSHPNSIIGTRGYYVASVPSRSADSKLEDGKLYVAAFPAPWLIPA